MGCRQICLQEMYLRGQWMAHAWNSLLDVISYSTSNPTIALSSSLLNLTSISHLTPPQPIIPFPYVPSSHPPSTLPSFHHSHPSLNLPLLIIPFISYLPPPLHPVFVLCPIPLTSSFLILSLYLSKPTITPTLSNIWLFPIYEQYIPCPPWLPLLRILCPPPNHHPHLSQRVPHPLHFSHSVYIQCTCVQECSVCTCTGTSPHYMYMYNVHNSIQNVNI